MTKVTVIVTLHFAKRDLSNDHKGEKEVSCVDSSTSASNVVKLCLDILTHYADCLQICYWSVEALCALYVGINYDFYVACHNKELDESGGP